MDNDEIKSQRKMLHDLINKVTVIQSSLKLNLLKMKAGKELSEEDIRMSFEKSMQTTDELMTIINQYRTKILEDDNFIPDPEIDFGED